MRSKDKIDVRVELVNSKPWLKVYDLLHGRGCVLVPSFEDMMILMAGLIYCERRKYAGRISWDAGDMVRELHFAALELLDDLVEWPPPSWKVDAIWDRIAAQFKLEHRKTPPRQPWDWRPEDGPPP